MGGPPGDLYVVIQVKAHKQFKRDGSAVLSRLSLTYPQAVLGTTVEVDTLHGKASLDIPPGTTHGRDFRLRGQGISRLDGSGRGDQVVTVQVEVPHPRDLSEGQRLALALSLVLAADPPVLLLDEPTRGLDYAAKHQLAAILREQAAAGRTVLVATHDVEFTAQVADRVVVLADGEIVSEGPTRRVVAESPAFAPQVGKVLGAGWLRVDEVVAALGLPSAPDLAHPQPAWRGEEGQVPG